MTGINYGKIGRVEPLCEQPDSDTGGISKRQGYISTNNQEGQQKR